MDDGFGGDDLARARLGAQPRGEVERAAPVAVSDRDRFAGVEPDAHPTREVGRSEPVLELDGRAQRLSGGHEHDERLVATKLEQESFAGGDHLLDQLGEAGDEIAGGLVTVLGGVLRVAADIGDQERPGLGAVVAVRRRGGARVGIVRGGVGWIRHSSTLPRSGGRPGAAARAECTRGTGSRSRPGDSRPGESRLPDSIGRDGAQASRPGTG